MLLTPRPSTHRRHQRQGVVYGHVHIYADNMSVPTLPTVESSDRVPRSCLDHISAQRGCKIAGISQGRIHIPNPSSLSTLYSG